jgi:tripeptide aminopeptidase
MAPAIAAAELAEDAAERFLRYVQIDTQSEEDSETYPSTEKQLDLLRLLVDELEAIGLENAAIDEHGYVTATLPSTVDREVPAIAFFAHVDTAREASGAGVKPQRIRYDGGEIPLGSSGQVIRPTESPQLASHAGHELITTDGTTLLGADDKSGIAEIMAAVAYLHAHPEIPHGPVKVAFNPDEEVGRGVIHFPVDTFGVAAAYTVDGSTAGEVQSETFSGAQVRMHIRGRAIHPGWAKGELVNAIKLAAAIVEKLPKNARSPETTEDREGYVHPVIISGDSSEVELRLIVRDFENDALDEHIEFLRGIAREVAATDERCSIEVESRIQYRNMRDTLDQHPEIVANLEEAVRRIGLEPRRTSIRGGTDGSALTEMGLPTPNIFTGGHDAHSEREWICIEDMGLAAATIVELAKVWAESGTVA